MDEPVLDVCTIGRCGVDLYPLEMNTHLEDVTRFGKFCCKGPDRAGAREENR